MSASERLRLTLFHAHPHWCFASSAFIFGTLSASNAAASTMVPSILLLSTFLLYGPIALNARRAFWHIAAIDVAASIGTAIPMITPASSALSSPAVAVVMLFFTSLLTSTMTLGIVLLHANLRARLSNSVLLFPAMYATLWYTMAHGSPLGYLGLPSGAGYDAGASAYGWSTSVFGQPFHDWLTAAWGVVLCHVMEAWQMGSSQPEEMPLLIDDESGHRRQANKVENKITYHSRAPALAALLILLALPSYLPGSTRNMPLALTPIEDATPLGVGCVIPTHQNPSLDDYIKESQTVRASAKVILWPEGAVHFDNETHREASFHQIRQQVPGTWIGVSYEETFTDPLNPHALQRRTAMSLISSWQTDETVPLLTYTKRHLVPIAESFSLTHSLVDPTVYSIPLPPPVGVRKPDWTSSPPYTRAIPVTASICLDFAHPAPFSALATRPALVLAPAKTWDVGIGAQMFVQARRRAHELGSTLLWCDGGVGGVSGLAGRGFNEPLQRGPGSWTRQIAIGYPFADEERTWFATAGSGFVLPFLWALILGGAAVESDWTRLVLARTGGGVAVGARSVWRKVREVAGRARQWRIGAQSVPEGDLLG